MHYFHACVALLPDVSSRLLWCCTEAVTAASHAFAINIWPACDGCTPSGPQYSGAANLQASSNICDHTSNCLLSTRFIVFSPCVARPSIIMCRACDCDCAHLLEIHRHTVKLLRAARKSSKRLEMLSVQMRVQTSAVANVKKDGRVSLDNYPSYSLRTMRRRSSISARQSS